MERFIERDTRLKEFAETSKYNELLEIASDRNLEILDGIRKIAPSVHRTIKLRGRLPLGRDIDDILYDYNDFENANFTRDELIGQLGNFSLAETTYYRLASNFAYNTAGNCGLGHRVDDLVDLAKDTVGRVVWNNWKPENGEDFIDLHNKVYSTLRYHLIHLWAKRHKDYPFSFLKDYVLDKAEMVDPVYSKSPEEKPIFRFRKAIVTIPLPAIIAKIDCNPFPIEKISALALIGYYPNGRGFTGVALELGIKRETLSSALDRAIINLRKTEATLPERPIKEIIHELREGVIMKYASGKNVEFDSPRLRLLRLRDSFGSLNDRDSRVLRMATARDKNTFIYSLNEIATTNGCSCSKVAKIMKRIANSPEK